MRRPSLEIQGRLYHIITRGNNRQLIFGSDDDYRKSILQLANQKPKLPFYLYAYCLMPRRSCVAARVERLVLVKEAMIIVGRELGVSNADMAKLLRLDASVVSRRYESGKAKMEESQEARRLVKDLAVNWRATNEANELQFARLTPYQHSQATPRASS
jgi:hypothetical protein